MSTLSMNRGARKPKSYLYVIVLLGEAIVEEMGMHLPFELTDLLDVNVDLMSEILLKVIPPQCTIDHCNELELGSKLMAKDLYQLSRPDLEELKKKLSQLTDIGFIRILESPYGIPMLS